MGKTLPAASANLEHGSRGWGRIHGIAVVDDRSPGHPVPQLPAVDHRGGMRSSGHQPRHPLERERRSRRDDHEVAVPPPLQHLRLGEDGDVGQHVGDRRDLAAGERRPRAVGDVDEDKVESVGEVEDIAAGATKDATFKLAAGKYALICNLAGHYTAGMRVTFTVQ